MFNRRRERQLSQFVPWIGPVRDDARLLADGSMLAAFAIDGVSWEAADPNVIEADHERLNMTWRNVGGDHLILTTYQCRGDASPADYPSGRFRSAFAETLDHAYRDGLFAGSLYANTMFLFVQVRPARPAGEWIGERMDKRRGPATVQDAPEDRMRRLDLACDTIAASFAKYGPRRLGTAIRGREVFCELAEAATYALTGVWRAVPLTTGFMGRSMLSETIIFGRETIEVRGAGWTQFVAMLGMQAYPDAHWPGQFNGLLAANYRHTTMHSFRCMGQGEGVGMLTRKQNFMVAAGDKAHSQIEELAAAADGAQSGKFIMGDHAFSMAVFADDIRALRNVATAASRDLADAGVKVARETIANQAAFLSMLPGNHRLRVRPGAISSRAYASFCPMHAYPPGEWRGHWGEPIALFRTTGGTPYRFHLHVGDVGNVFVTGRAGSGKTTWLAFIIAQSEKAGAQAIVWDKDRGLEIAVRALGGSYVALRNGEPSVAPLKALSSSPGDMAFLRTLLHGCITHDSSYEVTPEDDRRLMIGLRAVMALPPSERGLADIAAFLPQSDPDGAAPRLMRWAWGRELGWVIDGPEHLVDLAAPVVGFDQTHVIDNAAARGPILSTLFHLCEARIDGRRLLFVLDEFWKALLDPGFAALIHDKLKTLRKRGAPMILATQSPTDALNSPIAHTIVEQCPTMVHFANPRARRAGYGKDGLGLSEPQVETIATLEPGTGMFLLDQGGQSVTAQLPLHGMADEIAVLSGRDETVRLLDVMPAGVLANPARMLAAFHAARRHAKETAP